MRRQDDTEESVKAQTTRMEGLSAQRLRQEEEEEEESLSFVSGVGTDSESGSKLRQGFPSKIKWTKGTVLDHEIEFKYFAKNGYY